MWALLLRHPSVLAIFSVAGEATTTFVADRWSPLIQLGAVGCILLYFLIKLDPRLKRVEQAIDRSSRAQMLAVIAMRGVPDNIKEQAVALKNELEGRWLDEIK